MSSGAGTDTSRIQQALPGYVVDDELGRGGVGVVLGATHARLGRRVAIKRLPDVIAADESIRRRFVNEARVLAALDHPHIVPLYDFVEEDGLCLLVMEQLSGGSLLERHEANILNRAEACAAALATSAALSYAHDHDILHRDIKPANLMFGAEGTLKVVDFGIAKVLGGDESLATAAGAVLGSPPYMAPEQVTGEPLSTATDVYALATVLYVLLTGRLPYLVAEGPLQMLMARVNGDPPSPAEVADVPAALSDVVARGLARVPDDRHPSAEAFGVDVAHAATAAFGAGWLAESESVLYATGDLLRALDGARADQPAPASAVLLPPAPDEPKTAVLGSAELARLVPVRKVIQPAPERGLDLEIAEPSRAPRRVTVTETTAFGRKCEGVKLADSEVSRRHFVLRFTDAGVVVEDLGSTNGTARNGTLVEGPTPVEADDRLEAGDTTVTVIGGSALEPGSAAEQSTDEQFGDAAPTPELPREEASGSPPRPADEQPTLDLAGAGPTVVVDLDVPVGPSADAVARSLGDAVEELAALGLEPSGPGVRWLRVMSALVAADGTPIGAGTAVDPSSGSVWLAHEDAVPVDHPRLAVAWLAALRRPIAAQHPALVEGFALRVAGAPDPSATLAADPLPPLADAEGTARAALGRSFVGYLEHYVGLEAVAGLIAECGERELEDRFTAMVGQPLSAIEAAWRGWLASVAMPAAVLPGPLRAPWWSPGPRPAPAPGAPVALVWLLQSAAAARGVPAARADELASEVRRVTLDAGADLPQGTRLAAILEGGADVVLGEGRFAGTVVAKVGPGAVLGSADGGTRPVVSVRATTTTRLAVIEVPPGPASPRDCTLPPSAVVLPALAVLTGVRGR